MATSSDSATACSRSSRDDDRAVVVPRAPRRDVGAVRRASSSWRVDLARAPRAPRRLGGGDERRGRGRAVLGLRRAGRRRRAPGRRRRRRSPRPPTARRAGRCRRGRTAGAWPRRRTRCPAPTIMSTGPHRRSSPNAIAASACTPPSAKMRSAPEVAIACRRRRVQRAGAAAACTPMTVRHARDLRHEHRHERAGEHRHAPRRAVGADRRRPGPGAGRGTRPAASRPRSRSASRAAARRSRGPAPARSSMLSRSDVGSSARRARSISVRGDLEARRIPAVELARVARAAASTPPRSISQQHLRHPLRDRRVRARAPPRWSGTSGSGERPSAEPRWRSSRNLRLDFFHLSKGMP